jgi:S-formylglutathione hydrolase FrmB
MTNRTPSAAGRDAAVLSRRALIGAAAAGTLLRASPSLLRAADAVAATAPAAAAVPATGPMTRPPWAWSNPPKTPIPLLTHHEYESASMKTRVGYQVYLPPGYADAGNAARYPVLYWTHGLTHSESSDLFPPKLVEQAIKEKALPPAIVVYANGGSESWYADSADGKWLAETTFIRELIPHVDATYRTVPDRKGRAIHGMSMGGGGAVKFALKYPDLFSSVVAYAPSFRTVEDMQLEFRQARIYRYIFDNDPARFMAEHPFTLLKKNVEQVRGKVGIKVYIGTADKPVLMDGCRKFHALLDELKVPHEFTWVEGAIHNLGKLLAAAKTDGLAFAAKHFG